MELSLWSYAGPLPRSRGRMTSEISEGPPRNSGTGTMLPGAHFLKQRDGFGLTHDLKGTARISASNDLVAR